MNTEPKPTVHELFPLPEGIKLRTRKFETNPVSPLVPVPVGRGAGDPTATPAAFAIGWEDPARGLTVTVRERDGGHLIAEVSAADPTLLNKAAISVGLVGTVENGQIRKTIPLSVPAANGCRGSADFGPLAAAVRELGSEIGIVAFLLV